MMEKTAKEVERQVEVFDRESVKYDHLLDTEAFGPAHVAIQNHNHEMGEILKLLHRPDTVHMAVWDYSFDRLCDAFSHIMEEFNALETRQEGQKSDFAKVLEEKQQYTVVEESSTVEKEKEKTVETPVEDAFPQTESPDMDASCKTTEACTQGQCHTLQEAADACKESGMQVVEHSAPVEEEASRKSPRRKKHTSPKKCKIRTLSFLCLQIITLLCI